MSEFYDFVAASGMDAVPVLFPLFSSSYKCLGYAELLISHLIQNFNCAVYYYAWKQNGNEIKP